jgi:hypothetical protein
MWKLPTDLPWFANRGQIIQVVTAIAAFMLGAYIAWPHLKANDFLSAGSILFYLVAASVIFQLRRFPLPQRDSPPLPLPPQPQAVKKDEDPFPTRTKAFTHTFSVGELFVARSHGTTTIKITLRGIVPNTDKKDDRDPEYFADVQVDMADFWLLNGGPETKKISDGRWHMPEGGRSIDRSVSCFSLGDTYFHCMIFKVEHIDHHAHEAIITLYDVVGSKRDDR